MLVTIVSLAAPVRSVRMLATVPFAPKPWSEMLTPIVLKFSTWLLQIAHNLIVDHVRRQRPQADAEETEHVLGRLDAPDRERPEEILSDFEQRRRLQLALEALPDEQRIAFLLRVDSGLSLEEIAQVTGAGHETVKSRLRYAFAKIRERLAE